MFKAFEPFERYGFNKAHATCYGLIAYQTAYLKANYPVEYMTSVLTAFRDNTDKVAGAVAECRRLGIEVLPPDIHASGLHFTVEGQAIRFGLLAVKNVGQGAIESIVAARETGGDFRSLADLCARVDLRLVNKRVLESLVKVGALSAFGHPAQLLLGARRCDGLRPGGAARPDLRAGLAVRRPGRRRAAASSDRCRPATEAPSRERSRWEKELLGLYLSDHPLGELAPRWARTSTPGPADMGEELDQQRIVLGGVVTGLRRVITKASRRWPWRPSRTSRARPRSSSSPRSSRRPARPGSTTRCCWSPGGSTTRARRRCSWPTRSGPGSRYWRSGPTASGPRSRQGTGAGAAARTATVGWNGAGGPNGNGGGPRREQPGRRRRGQPVAARYAEARTAVPVRPQPVAIAVEPLVRTVPLVSPLRGGGVTGSIEVMVRAGARRHPSRHRRQPAPSPPSAASPVDADGPRTTSRRGPRRRSSAKLLRPSDPPRRSRRARGRRSTSGSARRPWIGSWRRSVRCGSCSRGVRATPRCVLHVPAGGGREQPMQLRSGVAYDAELLGEVERRVGGLVRLELS